ncbi:MAG: glycosyl transferase family 1 [Anaeromyxobacter sp. RBG_16_69_14]|nr:MAG: glycosyl transferase family 1 [Anaeromyxobacter sp. RBG_16_69_14]
MNTMTSRAQGEGEAADVALLLEGTYPFVRGGVSSWVHQIISALPEVTFSLVFMGSRRQDYGEPAYKPPPNVRQVVHRFLFDPVEEPPRSATDKAAQFDAVAKFHSELRASKPGQIMRSEGLDQIMRAMGDPSGIGLGDLLHSDRAWHRICEAYQRECPGGSFLDFFWTIRTMHASLFGLGDLARCVPAARSYHAVSTGYAGFLGAMLRKQRGRPLILTEHGIYTKERKIDLASAAHLPGDGADGQGFGRRLWIRFFEGLGRITYAEADPVISLYDGNRQRQLQDGAPAERTRVIPNGVDVDRFRPLRALRPPKPPLVIGLLGRVVPIKDIKTFIRAMKTVFGQIPEAEAWIIGPTEEDKAYFAECTQLAATLGLGDRLKFLGFAAPETVLPKVGLLALTSISEALPLVILEAFASGLPVIATDVGACRELVEGRTPEDRALGAGGAIVPISDPEATARAAIELLRDPVRWKAAQEAGIKRVETFYTRAIMIDAYRQVYQEAIADVK